MSRLARLVDQLRHQRFDPQAPVDTSYQESRARRESAAAELARMELRRRAAELMDVEAVQKCLAGLAGELRQALAGLPAEIAEAIKPLAGDEAAIRAEMQRRIDAALARAADALEGRG